MRRPRPSAGTQPRPPGTTSDDAIPDDDESTTCFDDFPSTNVESALQQYTANNATNGTLSVCMTGRLGTSLITSSQPLMLLLAVFVYDPLTRIVSLFLAAD